VLNAIPATGGSILLSGSYVTGVLPQANGGSGTTSMGICKAWANFVGSSGSINQQFNVASITRNGAGDYTVTFTNALSSAYYSVNGSVLPTTSQTNTTYARCIVLYYNVTPTTTSFRFQTVTGGVGPEDFAQVSIGVFGV
jgi:hypothetical protein